MKQLNRTLFPLTDIEVDDIILAETRVNVSCAIRFSEPPISREAQATLTNLARRFLPAHPSDGLLPIRVSKLNQADLDWIRDRGASFANYSNDPGSARHRMGQLFNVACSALAAINVLGDDKSTHHVTAKVPSLTSFPLRFEFRLEEMSSESGWTVQRPADVWIEHSSIVGRTLIKQTQFSFTSRALDVQLHTMISSHQSLQRAVRRHSRMDNGQRVVDMCVKLTRAPTGTDPVYELLAGEELFAEFSATYACRGNDVLDKVYGNADRPIPQRQVPYPPLPRSVTIGSSTFQLRADQIHALELGGEEHPVLAIQAAYGTGKTVVGALLAARLANPGHIIVATATTNTAVAQFADTLLSLSEYRHLNILRFVSDSALVEGAPTTDVDLHVILKGLSANYANQLRAGEESLCESYARGRELIENTIFHPERTLFLTDEEREEYRIAEKEISDATDEAVAIMFRVRRPSIVCMTTASLLNATSRSGIFKAHLLACRVIIGDEASQIPEPAFVAMATRFAHARHIYIGDVHQLEPHVRCPRSSTAALFGAKGLMELLLHTRVPLAPLTTTFRMHPALNDLPNRLFYDGSLVSGADPASRRLLLENCRTPNPQVPFVFVDTVGTSHRSPSGSHFNEGEAQTCRDIVQALTARQIPASSIAVITFYKEQFRLMEQYAEQQGIALHTVDSVQGRETDIVILLTTRTDIEPARAEFLDDKLRMNVAITRCRHGMFVLGRMTALESLPVWSRLLQWARERDVIVTTTTLPDLFD
ncbi:hypothetical protein ANCCEY_13099 [Ancylostoma ceylanicum]|uniref:DNA2/NAM7 helicase-like C-terminal domain-containing protein n=1 Tax=Ancylostoma ceylanicum TaxID=53326 RepID=A0A0D6LD84_9BILA|nr:hypothetical protein ANCCEY_13099 [Ancylostoma ceylanicum]